MKVATFADEAAAREAVDAINKAMGYPMRSVNVGEGRHVFGDIPEEWDGQGEPPPGWCANYVEVHSAEGKEFAVPIADNDAQRVTAELAKLESKETAAVQAALAGRRNVDLDLEGYVVAKASAVAEAEATVKEG